MSELSSATLIERLVHLAGEERAVQAAFLVHLDEFDRRRGYLVVGHDSLWSWCVRVLHLSEGAAGRRIAAMRISRRFPQIVNAFRDGRLSLSTVALLGQVLTPENVEDLVARAAYKTRGEVDQLVASLRPRHAPKDGVRLLAAGRSASAARAASSSATGVTCRNEERAADFANGPTGAAGSGAAAQLPGVASGAGGDGIRSDVPGHAAGRTLGPAMELPAHHGNERPFPGPPEDLALSAPGPGRSRADLRPISRDQWSVRVTIDAECREELETLRQLLSHKCGNDLASVLREAIRCGIEKHGKRRGAIRPSRSPARSSSDERSEGRVPDKVAPARDAGSPGTDASLARRGSLGSDASLARGGPPGTCEASGRDGSPARERLPASDGLPEREAAPGRDQRQPGREAIPAAVRQAVYDRDGGCCSYVSPEGRRCGSKWKLEFDHVLPAFLGGPSTVDNLRLVCRAHNVHHAEQVFGMEHMERFLRRYGIEGYG